MRRVAITGLGVVSPLGNGAQNFFDRLVQGHSGVTRLPEDFNPRLMSRVVAPVSFDGAAHFGAARLRMLDRVSQFALVAAAEAIADAGALFERDDRDTTGVFVGTGMGGAQSTDEGYQTVYEERSDRVKPYTVLMAMNNAAAAWIGIDHHLLGPNLTYSSCMFFVGRRDRRSVEAHCHWRARRDDRGRQRSAAHFRYAEGMGGAEDTGDGRSG